VKFWHFALATFLTLPKQIIIVYFGVLLVQETKNDTINTVVLAITFLFTIIAGVYIYLKMRKTKVILLREQEERAALRRAKKEQKEHEPEHMDFGLNAEWSSYNRF
jgi:hypothetical protein